MLHDPFARKIKNLILDLVWYNIKQNSQVKRICNTELNICLVPPDILDHPTSTDMVVREGSTVTLTCAASGSPNPSIVWRREAGEAVVLNDGSQGNTCHQFVKTFKLIKNETFCNTKLSTLPLTYSKTLKTSCVAKCIEGRFYFYLYSNP